MISRIKKIQFVCMCILLLLVVMGCQIKRTDNNSGNNNVGLIKNEVDLPTGYISVFSIETKSENELYVVLGTDAGESSVYILNIVDGSWTLYQDVKELLENIDYNDYFVSVSKNGEIFICCSENNNETGAVVSTQKYYIFDKKDVREVKIDLQPLEEGNADEFAEALGIDSSKVTNVITSILTEENVFYLTDINGYLYKINEEANENSLVYKCEQKIGDIRSILQKNDDLVILYSNGVATFNMILSILVYTLFSRMFDLMQPPVVKHSIVVA